MKEVEKSSARADRLSQASALSGGTPATGKGKEKDDKKGKQAK
jgi:hypothetical protein